MSTSQRHNILQNLLLINPVPTLPETAVTLYEEVGDKEFCTALAMGDHLVTKRKLQKAAAEHYGMPASAVQWAISQDPTHSKGGRQYAQEWKRKMSDSSAASSTKQSRDVKKKSHKSLTSEIQQQSSNKISVLFRTTPILPRRNTLRKAWLKHR